MGFFSDVKQTAGLKVVRQTCEANGLYEGSGMENCERCRHVVRGQCVTGLACSGMTMSDGGNMVVLANYKCEHFER